MKQILRYSLTGTGPSELRVGPCSALQRLNPESKPIVKWQSSVYLLRPAFSKLRIWADRRGRKVE